MISIFGMGFVGAANAELLSRKNKILCYDINSEVLKKYPQYTTTENIINTLLTDIFIICVPTDGADGRLDCSKVEECIGIISDHVVNPVIIIRSTIPIGFTDKMRDKYIPSIYFVPEFLREGNEYDILNPSRIIASSEHIAEIFYNCTRNDPPVMICSNSEAEAIKLFSNAFLAGRVALFNEIDSECLQLGLDAGKVISGMCADSRIGNYYNNPSFGYGGYCFPKDSQEVANMADGKILQSIPESNEKRKKTIADYIRKRCEGKRIGVYKIGMKSGSTNTRCSAILDIIDMLNYDIESVYTGNESLQEFFDKSDVIICNRYESALDNFKGEIITRDIFGRD